MARISAGWPSSARRCSRWMRRRSRSRERGRGHGQALHVRRVAEAGEGVEERGGVLADGAVGGHEAEVGVDARRLLVVVARPHVDVALDALEAAAHDQADLGVGLVAANAVDDVRPRLLERARPLDVRLLVEARHQLHDDGDLLARLRRPRQRLHDGAVAAGAIQRLLDGEDVGVGGGLRDERDHRVERLVRMVEEDFAFRHPPEHVGEVERPRLQRRQRLEGRLAEVLEGGQLHQRKEGPHVQRTAHVVDVRDFDLEPLDQDAEQGVADPLLHLQPDHPAEAPLAQLVFDRLQVVAPAFLVQLHLRVARDAEGGRLQDRLAREQRGQLGPDDLLEQDVRVAVAAQRPHQAPQPGRHLHHGQPRLLAPFRGREQDGEVEAQVRELREGPGDVDGQRA